MDCLDNYEQTLLAGWEEVHKKSQLSLWILLALQRKAGHMAEIKTFIEHATNGMVSADDKSMYRSLRRFVDAQIIDFVLKPSQSGPDLKVYTLTDSGKRILDAFVERNIAGVFFAPHNIRLLRKSM